jgi:hypothetical protein
MPETEAEVLEAAPTKRLSRRRRLAVVTLVVALGITAFLVDRRSRAGEEQELADCGSRAAAAVEQAYTPIEARWARARRDLDGGASLMVRYGIYRQLSDSADGASSTVARARRTCAEVSVLAVHPALVTRRDACLRLLDEHVDFLAQVGRSGVTLNGAWPQPLTGC